MYVPHAPSTNFIIYFRYCQKPKLYINIPSDSHNNSKQSVLREEQVELEL